MIRVIPYIEIDGCRTLRDSEILSLYERMKNEGTIDIVFYDCDMNNPRTFLAFAKSERNKVFTVWNDKLNPTLFVYLSNVFNGNALVHFCSFAGISGREKIRSGEIMVDRLLSFLDLLIGVIPQTNPRAVRFAEMIGFRQIGIIPHFSYLHKEGKKVGANFLYIERRK